MNKARLAEAGRGVFQNSIFSTNVENDRVDILRLVRAQNRQLRNVYKAHDRRERPLERGKRKCVFNKCPKPCFEPQKFEAALRMPLVRMLPATQAAHANKCPKPCFGHEKNWCK